MLQDERATLLISSFGRFLSRIRKPLFDRRKVNGLIDRTGRSNNRNFFDLRPKKKLTVTVDSNEGGLGLDGGDEADDDGSGSKPSS